MGFCSFGVVLRQLRKRSGLTQEALGARIGLSKAVVSKYENELGYPTYDVLIRIADYFGVTTDYLLGVKSQKVIDVSGLTDSQIDAVAHLVSEFKNTNKK